MVSPTAVIPYPWPRAEQPSSGKRTRARLPVITAETRLSFPVNKGQRISQLVEGLSGTPADAEPQEISEHPCYVGFFRCWNEQRYYEAHDVLEHLWLRTKSDDANYFKGLIQAAGAFVHLQKQHARPTHPKDGRRMYPAVRLFRLAEKNLASYAPMRHRFDVAEFLQLLRRQVDAILASDHRGNPWTPEGAPKIALDATGKTRGLGQDELRPGDDEHDRQD
jgi:predicted metal-dependent hydrolase